MESSAAHRILIKYYNSNSELPLLDVYTSSQGGCRKVLHHYHYHRQAYMYSSVWDVQFPYCCAGNPIDARGTRLERRDTVKITRDNAHVCLSPLDDSVTCPHPYYRSLEPILHATFQYPHSLFLTHKLSWGSRSSFL